MDLNLGGKIAIVTGGSAGIGLACAKTLFNRQYGQRCAYKFYPWNQQRISPA
jgi:NAD(P)-dependent dehydrogenase (short-subunit alcohol dehydrogenase family)